VIQEIRLQILSVISGGNWDERENEIEYDVLVSEKPNRISHLTHGICEHNGNSILMPLENSNIIFLK
jgi:hypothetical protein